MDNILYQRKKQSAPSWTTVLKSPVPFSYPHGPPALQTGAHASTPSWLFPPACFPVRGWRQPCEGCCEQHGFAWKCLCWVWQSPSGLANVRVHPSGLVSMMSVHIVPGICELNPPPAGDRLWVGVPEQPLPETLTPLPLTRQDYRQDPSLCYVSCLSFPIRVNPTTRVRAALTPRPVWGSEGPFPSFSK